MVLLGKIVVRVCAHIIITLYKMPDSFNCFSVFQNCVLACLNACFVYYISVASSLDIQNKRSKNEETTSSGLNTTASVMGSFFSAVIVALVIVIVVITRRKM